MSGEIRIENLSTELQEMINPKKLGDVTLDKDSWVSTGNNNRPWKYTINNVDLDPDQEITDMDIITINLDQSVGLSERYVLMTDTYSFTGYVELFASEKPLNDILTEVIRERRM